MATLRLTSAQASTAANPVAVLSRVRLTYTPPVPKLRLTEVAFRGPANVKARLTQVSMEVEVYGAPPVVSAGEDFEISAGESWTLLGTETIAVGQTVTARRWWINSRLPSNAPDIVFSNATIAQPTFSAPVLEVDAQYEFAYQVTSSTGMTSAADSTIVYVFAADLRESTSAGWIPAGLLVATDDGWV